MAISSLLNDIEELHKPISIAAQIHTLKTLRNELVGHPERKESAIRHGVVPALAYVLSVHIKGREKQRTTQLRPGSIVDEQSEEYEAQLQAVTVVSTLAHGGDSSAVPLLASSIPQLLVEGLRTSLQPAHLRLAILKALLRLTELKLRPRQVLLENPGQISTLCSKTAVEAYTDILSHQSTSYIVSQQVSLTAQLLRIISRTENHRNLLVSGGVLDCLASIVASYTIQQRLRLHSSISAQSEPSSLLPPQALAFVIGAITAIIGDSRYRAARLLYSPPLLARFPFQDPETKDNLSHAHQPSNVVQQSILEPALPRTPIAARREETSFTKVFPALQSLQSRGRPPMSFVEIADPARHPTEKPLPAVEADSTLIPWLIYTMRDEEGLTRLFAAELITLLLRIGHVSRSREHIFGLLVVPLLTNMIDPTASNSSDLTKLSISESAEQEFIAENAPVILANLIKDHPTLQTAAIDAGVVEKTAKMLKKTFLPVKPRSPPWSADATAPDLMEETDITCKMGPSGLLESMIVMFGRRSASLNLIAAIAEKEDKYRKMLKEQGIVSFIIDSMAPLNEEVVRRLIDGSQTEVVKATEVGNTAPVLIAACHAIRALSRAVAILKTVLIDAGTAKPTLTLLTHPTTDVVVAATDVVCNLLVDFSPVRNELQDAGVIKILSGHAHSADSRVRHGSLWALKHLVQANTNEAKLHCFEELGTGWLIQIITGGSATSSASRSVKTSNGSLTLGAANAAGERVDILNAVEETSTSADELDDAIDDNSMDLNTPTNTTPSMDQAQVAQNASLAALVAKYRPRLAEIKLAELTDLTYGPQLAELEIQIQGLDFIRNLMLGTGASEMIDCIFNVIGSARVFQIIVEKLQFSPDMLVAPGTTIASTTNTNTNPNTDTSATTTPPLSTSSPSHPSHSKLPPPPSLARAQADVTRSAIFIINHISGGTPTHRNLLTSQPALLRALLPHLHHVEQGIRVLCVWTVISLTWVDDESDVQGARQRARELRNLGFEARLTELLTDESLDVRERVSTALAQFDELLDGVSGGGGGGGSGRGGSGSGSGSGGGGNAMSGMGVGIAPGLRR